MTLRKCSTVIAGIAARTTLGNVFAVMQIAFTDAIRVGDIVSIGGRWGTAEEITRTNGYRPIIHVPDPSMRHLRALILSAIARGEETRSRTIELRLSER